MNSWAQPPQGSLTFPKLFLIVSVLADVPWPGMTLRQRWKFSFRLFFYTFSFLLNDKTILLFISSFSPLIGFGRRAEKKEVGWKMLHHSYNIWSLPAPTFYAIGLGKESCAVKFLSGSICFDERWSKGVLLIRANIRRWKTCFLPWTLISLFSIVSSTFPSFPYLYYSLFFFLWVFSNLIWWVVFHPLLRM